MLIINKITLITPCYNSENYLEKTILSVINQKYENLEYIIIDGGSNDSTLEIISKYSKDISISVSEKDNGMYHALKKGFEKATGEIYGWINSDDILLEGALNAVNKAFNEIENCQWLTGIPSNLTTDGITYLGSSNHFKREYTAEEYLNDNIYAIQQESTFFSSSLYKKVGGISLEYKLAGDYELWAKFFKEVDLYLFNCFVGSFRFHDNQLSSNISGYLTEVNEIREKYNSNIYKIKYKRTYFKKKALNLLPYILYRKLSRRKNLFILNKRLNKFLKKKNWN